MSKTALIVTSIAAPNQALRELAAGAVRHGWRFLMIGDRPSPADFALDGCGFYSLDRQRSLPLELARRCPERHYARKNIGYLLAIREGAECIVETDDDNLPYADFWEQRRCTQSARLAEGAGWTNVYRHFSDETIWPRGLPLDAIRRELPELPEAEMLECPIQQGLADDNPDVDAVYRLIMKLPVRFSGEQAVALGKGSWCPFNSQNTTWFPAAFPLLYLPAYCSFRMTDIWRSFVAQAIAHANGWPVLFHAATVRQERNEHNLMRDFRDEVPGYLQNAEIMRTLAALPLRAGAEAMADNLRACYGALVKMGAVGAPELPLLEAWLTDLAGG